MMVEIALADEAHPNLPDEVPPWSSSVIAKEGTWHLAARFRVGNTVYRGGEQRDLRRLWVTVGLGVSFPLFGFLVMRKVFPDSKVRAWAMLTTAPSVPGIDVDALLERRPDALVLDVREPEEYARHGHVPGAINVPQANLACRPDELPGDRPLLTICRGGVRSLRAGQYLKQAGFDEVASVKGGTEAWHAAGNRLDLDDTAGAQEPRVAESEWAHADAS